MQNNVLYRSELQYCTAIGTDNRKQAKHRILPSVNVVEYTWQNVRDVRVDYLTCMLTTWALCNHLATMHFLSASRN